MIPHDILVGTVTGFLVACGVDLHAYSESADASTFNWKKAVARWISGAIVGALGVKVGGL